MNATSLNALRNATAADARDLGDERMDQVRELLLGDHLRTSSDRITALESRLAEFETTIGQKIDALSARMEALSGEVDNNQRATFDELAKSLSDIGIRIRSMTRG